MKTVALFMLALLLGEWFVMGWEYVKISILILGIPIGFFALACLLQGSGPDGHW